MFLHLWVTNLTWAKLAFLTLLLFFEVMVIIPAQMVGKVLSALPAQLSFFAKIGKLHSTVESWIQIKGTTTCSLYQQM